MMDEIRQSALKVDFHKLEQRIAKIESKPDTQIKIQDTESENHDKRVEQQLSDMRRLMEVLLKDQDILKNNVQNLHIGFNQYKVPAKTQVQNQVRKSVIQQPEGESIIQPKVLVKDDRKTGRNNKKENSQSRSQSNKKLGDKINFKLNRTKTSKQILHQKK